ncbi:MAG: DUF2141 domain-containing protein [Massilia sp.]
MRACVWKPALVLALFAAAAANAANAANVVVTVKNVASASGTVRGAICDKETFLKVCSYRTSEKAKDDSVVLTFKDVPPGRYAFNAYHDENDNNKMDRNLIGIPTEGYAFSRDAKGRRGPPQFDDAAFDIKDGDNEIAVTLNY